MALTRRWMLGGAAATLATPRSARAQPATPVVGVLRNNPNDALETFTGSFRDDLATLGWRDGRNVRIVIRWADGRSDNLPELAQALVAARPSVLLAFGPPGLRAVSEAGRHTPVIGMSDDMVASGFAESMARPGGQISGISIFAAELEIKRMELLRELLPQARRIGVLYDPRISGARGPHLDEAAQTLGFVLIPAPADAIDAIGAALDTLIANRVDAVNVLASTILNAGRAITVATLHAARLPAIHQWPETAVEGGLLAYGPSLRGVYHQLAVFTDKVLRGALPATLPIEHPTKLELVVNLRAAREIGIEVPLALLARADTVIE
jgi:putative ABC transport system substrate-binding protein